MKPGIVLAAARSALRKTALAAAVSVLVLTPAASYALELGQATIISGLGQPLLVEIPYRLSAGEQLAPACIGLAPALRPAGALPAYTRASRVTITPTHIEIFGDSRVVEPLIGLNVDVRCESAPRFVRSYELFVDPPVGMPTASSSSEQPAPARTATANGATVPPVVENRPAAAGTPRATTAPRTAPANTEAPQTARANASLRARGQTGGALTQGETYVVVRGDTLSGIASRVGDRPTIRETAEAIFAANSSAFTRGNRDLLEAGRSITIPLMTATPAALPASPAAAPPPVVSEAPPAIPPSATAASAPPDAAPQLPAAITSSAVTPAAVETAPPAAAEPLTAPAQASVDATPAAATPASPSGRSSIWLTALLALGAAILLSAPVLFIRRRKQQPAAPSSAKTRSARPRQRQLVDPVAGFDVVESDMPHTATVKIEKPVPQRAESPLVTTPAHALNIGPTDSVDLDVGSPIVDQRVDWFSDRVDAAAATPVAPPAANETDATARLPELDRTATVRQPPLEPPADVTDQTLDDKQHTLTIVELDMLRQDYESEHTLTQQTNKELREALADLKATQAAHASNGDTATLEMPHQSQPDDGEIESQPTQKLRSSR